MRCKALTGEGSPMRAGVQWADLSRSHCSSAGFRKTACSGSGARRQQMRKPSRTAGAPSSRNSHCSAAHTFSSR